MSRPKDPKFTKDGFPDGRGHGEGSKETRFARGDGRKRPGRPKGTKDEKTIVNQIRNMKVDAKIKDRACKVNTQAAILMKQREKALKGDQRAAEFLDRKFQACGPPVVEPDHITPLLEADQEILNSAVQRGRIRPLADESDEEGDQ